MERYGQPIATYHLRRLETGITYRAPVGALVPEIEEREAARFNGYDWKGWRELPHEERVDGVAYFRVRKAIEANEEDAREKDMKRRSRHKGRK